MRKRPTNWWAVATIATTIMIATSCGGNNEKPAATAVVDYAQVATPDFDSDSAYHYAAEQLGMGFRVPGTKAHRQCSDWLEHTLRQWCDTVTVQEFSATLWNGNRVPGRNIIASLSPEKNNRVVLAAHWDSRMYADHDPDSNNWRKPIPGANDGASGVAVLMEMARTMSKQRPNVGIDFVLFDVEDQGIPEWANDYRDDTWCLGSQYWSRHPHRLFYTANYGILLDMVGTSNARFTKEQVSMRYAPGIMNKLWQAAAALGYGQMFVNEQTEPILDDHVYVNQLANIPMVDIVQNSPECSFYPYWHTVKDDQEAIDKNTMRAVARVVMAVIYQQ